MTNRLLNISIATVSILLILTGLRIWFYDQSSLPPVYLSWIDSVNFGGNVFNQHLVLGFILIGLVVFKAVLEFWQLIKIKGSDNSGDLFRQIKQFTELAIYLFLAALIVSGVSIYYGNFNSQVTLGTIKNVHIFCTWLIIIAGALYLVLWLLSRRMVQRPDETAAVVSRSGLVRTLVSMIVAATAVWLVFIFAERPLTLVSKNINRRIALNGREGIEWTGTDSVSVIATGGDNFRNGSTRITIKSFHTRFNIHFIFTWQDWEASNNRSLEKTTEGWRELKSQYSPFGESVYFEDQLAISFHKTKSGCLERCHLGNGSNSGLHFTNSDTADLWLWQSTSTNPAWTLDDGWWGEYLNDSVGGRHWDNNAGGGSNTNLNKEWGEPYFLPASLWLGNWILMQSDRYTPYRATLDNYKLGSTLPSRLVSRFMGDRGDVMARAQWQRGYWTLEITRKLKTGSPLDIDLRQGCWMSVAVFNNAEKKHAYQLKPIKLVIE